MSGRRPGPKSAWPGRMIIFLAFDVIRQRASKPPFVAKNTCVEFGSSGIVLEEAKLARDTILLTQELTVWLPNQRQPITIVNQVNSI